MFGIVSGVIGGAIALGGAIVSGITSVAAAIGPVVSGLAGSVIKIIAEIPGIDIETVNLMVNIIVDIVHEIVKMLEIESEEDPTVLGAKAEQAEKMISEFDNDVEAYIQYLRNEVQLDKEKFDKMSMEEKMGCQVIGMALEVKAIEEKMGGIHLPPPYLVTLAKIHGSMERFNAKDMVDLMQGLKAAGITNMNEISDLLEGRGETSRIKTGMIFEKVMADIYGPENTKEKIQGIESAIRNFDKEIDYNSNLDSR